MVEQLPLKEMVRGSNPRGRTKRKTPTHGVGAGRSSRAHSVFDHSAEVAAASLDLSRRLGGLELFVNDDPVLENEPDGVAPGAHFVRAADAGVVEQGISLSLTLVPAVTDDEEVACLGSVLTLDAVSDSLVEEDAVARALALCQNRAHA